MVLATERPSASVVRDVLSDVVKRAADPLSLPSDFAPSVGAERITAEMAASHAAVSNDKMARASLAGSVRS